MYGEGRDRRQSIGKVRQQLIRPVKFVGKLLSKLRVTMCTAVDNEHPGLAVRVLRLGGRR